MNQAVLDRGNSDPLSDGEVVERVRAGQVDLFEILMRRYNQRLYRICRSVLRDDSEAEDVAQEAWVRAFTHLDQFAGRAKFSTWLVRIALYEAWARIRHRQRYREIPSRSDSAAPEGDVKLPPSPDRDPEEEAFRGELASAIDAAVDTLPERYRSVFVLRELEDLDTAETAECLDLTEEAVKTRLHRARTLLQKDLLARAGATTPEAFYFAGARCDRIVLAVFDRIRGCPLLPPQRALSRGRGHVN